MARYLPKAEGLNVYEMAVLIEAMDGGVLDTGVVGFKPIVTPSRVLSWSLVSTVSGSCVIDVKSSTLAAYPTTASICNGSPPTLVSAFSSSGDLSPIAATILAANDVLEFNVLSAVTVTRVLLTLKLLRL